MKSQNNSYQDLKKIPLSPFEYHKELRDHFKDRKKTWEWFKLEQNKTQQVEKFKTELLKNTYRLDKESHKNLYDITDEVCDALSIDAQVILYQENNSIQLNAGISIIEKEAHIVLSGNLIRLLSNDEMKALLAHELSHYLFFVIEDGEYEVTQRIALALANDRRSEDAYIETARIFQLYIELFCDAGSLLVCKDYRVVIQTMVKINTGLTQVNADSYLAQAEEIIKNDAQSSMNQSHPESYIRSLALKLRSENDPEYMVHVKRLIEGDLDLNGLDIFEQTELQVITDDILQLILKPNWMHSSSVQNLSNQYFKDFKKKETLKKTEELIEIIEKTKISVKSYFSYVLFDFAKIDSDMENVPLAHTIEIAELLGIIDEYETVIRKELKLTIREFKLLKEESALALSTMRESKEGSIYNE